MTLKMLIRAIYATKSKTMRNHCHVTGKYRGSAHTDCNLSYRLINKN